MFHTEDIRIQWTKVVLPPVFLEEEHPVTEAASATIYNARTEITDILNGRDPRLLVLVGPCSIHDTKAAREYAALLQAAIQEFSADLRIVMRVYFEKPRTTIGWKGLINDPDLDQSYKINDGLRQARRLLLDLAEMGVPTGTEFLDMISPQYIAGLVSWGAQSYVAGYGRLAWGIYRGIIYGPFAAHPMLYVLLIAAGQLLAGALTLWGQKYQRLGLAGEMIFLAAIVPLGAGSAFPFSLPAIAALAVLYRRNGGHSLPEVHRATSAFWGSVTRAVK